MDRRAAIAVLGVAMLTALTACTAEEPEPTRTDADVVADGRLIDPARGAVTLRFGAGLLRFVGDEATAEGDASGSAAALRMPVIAGQFSVSSTELSGWAALNGSGVVFQGAEKPVRMTDLLVDWKAGTVAGDLAVGTGKARNQLLFLIDPATAKRAAATGDDVRLTGARILISDPTAKAVNAAFGRTVLVAQRAAGTIDLAIDGS